MIEEPLGISVLKVCFSLVRCLSAPTSWSNLMPDFVWGS